MKNMALYLYEIGQLKRVVRSGWWLAGIDNPESVAEHSFRVAVIGYFLACLAGGHPLKTMIMCLFHDVHEARVNDLHRVGQRYAPEWSNSEERAILEQTSGLPADIRENLTGLLSDLGCSDSLEAKISHDADLLECLIQAREYQSQGYGDVLAWIENCRAGLITEAAKGLADECLQIEPTLWWQDLMSKTKGDS